MKRHRSITLSAYAATEQTLFAATSMALDADLIRTKDIEYFIARNRNEEHDPNKFMSHGRFLLPDNFLHFQYRGKKNIKLGREDAAPCRAATNRELKDTISVERPFNIRAVLHDFTHLVVFRAAKRSR